MMCVCCLGGALVVGTDRETVCLVRLFHKWTHVPGVRKHTTGCIIISRAQRVAEAVEWLLCPSPFCLISHRSTRSLCDGAQCNANYLIINNKLVRRRNPECGQGPVLFCPPLCVVSVSDIFVPQRQTAPLK